MATVRVAAAQMQEAQQIVASFPTPSTPTKSTPVAIDITGEAPQPTANTPSAAPPSASPLSDLQPFDEGDEEAVQILQGMSKTIELDLVGTDDDSFVEDIGDNDDDWELLDDAEAIDRDTSHAVPYDTPPPGPDQSTMGVDFLNTYRASVQPVMSALESQMRRAIWNGRPIQVHQPADDAEVSACN